MHVAIIMDGNGRWAGLRGLPRTAGHHAGAKAVKRIVETAARLPIDVLTLYAFSSDNWARPSPEVRALFALLKRYLRSESSRCAANGIAVRFLGRRDRFADDLRALIEHTEQVTRHGEALQLQIAADYSSRDQLRDAPADDAVSCDVDLLIRTGGEQRLSDFMLWESAYAELLFLDKFWPDFDAADLRAALGEYERRDRRFGRVSAAVSSPAPGYL
jgi:undecaprenyl diphosphate synthase